MFQTNQKYLETILKRSLVEPSPELQWIITRCLPYDFKVKYIKGKDKCTCCLYIMTTKPKEETRQNSPAGTRGTSVPMVEVD